MSDRVTQTTASAANKALILAVDDESYVRELVCRWLKDAGHTCAQAANAQAAWEYLGGNEVHLMVLDVNMPGRNGLELLKDVHKTYPDVAVLMMTGNGETRVAIDALTNGAWGYLMKPVERQELACQVARVLEHRQLRLQQRDYMRTLEAKVREQTAEIREAHEETIYRLVAASLCRDEETGMHIKRTGLLSEVMARAAGWSEAEADIIRMAAPMHDVGKIGIPDAILRKPGKLTPEEFDVMKSHTIIGANMLAGSRSAILSMACNIALSHHENWDGSGYPQGLVGAAIPEAARIVSVIDVYDALSHDRVYRPKFSEEETLRIMSQDAGKKFDPALMAVFFANYEELRQLAQENPDESWTESGVLPLLRGEVAGTGQLVADGQTAHA
jgi:putative two-component system response regulator